MSALSKLAEADTIIAFIIRERGQEAGFGVFEALDAPHITDEVFTVIAVYRSPFLVWQIRYSIYENHRPFTNLCGSVLARGRG